MLYSSLAIIEWFQKKLVMVGAKEIVGLSVVFLVITGISSVPEDVSIEVYDPRSSNWPASYDDKVRFLIESNQRSISAMKRLVKDLETSFGKRTSCLIDGGMASACRNRDLLEAMDNHRFLASPFAPGRRKRSSADAIFN